MSAHPFTTPVGGVEVAPSSSAGDASSTESSRMATKDKVAETHALPRLGEALEQALSLREPDERHYEVDPAGAGLKLAIPPYLSATTTTSGSSSRPSLPSMHSSFATTSFSSRSPASRTTSNTSIHDSLASVSKDGTRSPIFSSTGSSHPPSPPVRRVSGTSNWSHDSRSPSVVSESAYPALPTIHSVHNLAPLPPQAYPSHTPHFQPAMYPQYLPYGAPAHAAQPPPASLPAPYVPFGASTFPYAHPHAAYLPASAGPYQRSGPPQMPHFSSAPNAPLQSGGNGYDLRTGGMTHAQHLPHTGYPPTTYPYGLSNSVPYQFPPQLVSAPPSATHPPVVFSHPFLLQPQGSPSVPTLPHSLDDSPPASIQQRASMAGSEGQQLFYPISSARSSVTSSVPSWPSDPNVQQGRSASVSQVHASPVHPVVAGGLPSAFAASPQDSVFPAQLPRPPASGPSRHSSETRTSVASPASAGPAPSPLNPLGSNKSSPTGPGVSSGYAPSPVRGTAYGRRKDLPRPPVHSPHALWVGNVPSDASHAELWQFFQTRPTPAMCGKALSPSELHVDLDVNGVESIHLIARSNCAFVNYLSSTHLYHAIDVSNGVALRPDDPRCKKLICRVRHQGDDSRSGVGAQRQGGMHKAFVREQQVRMAESQREIRDEVASRRESSELSVSPGIAISPSPLASPVGRTERERSLASVGSSSTTSSFLTKHFERRYFILKSHDEADLRKSVETGVWATQTHNEPVLQQAFRTARSVYIIFGANGTGCWFGYARMVGPIGEATSSGRSSLPSAGSRDALSSTSTEMRFSSAATILEEPEQLEGAASPAARRPLISPSEHRYADSSPLGLTPSSANSYAGRVLAGLPATRSTSQSQSGQSTPQGAAGGHGNRESAHAFHPTGHIPLSAQREMAREQDLIARETADKLHLPPEAAEAARRAASLGSSVPPATGGGKVVPEERGAKSLEDRSKHDVVAKAAEARNAKLEKIEATMESQTKNSPGTDAKPALPRIGTTWGTPFAVEWIQVQNLPFPRTRHIRNSFNGNREIKVSRDGTEVEPVAGELLLNEFWRTDLGSPSEVPLRPASPQPAYEAPSPRDELAAATAAAPDAQHEAASPAHKVEAKAASA